MTREEGASSCPNVFLGVCPPPALVPGKGRQREEFALPRSIGPGFWCCCGQSSFFGACIVPTFFAVCCLLALALYLCGYCRNVVSGSCSSLSLRLVFQAPAVSSSPPVSVWQAVHPQVNSASFFSLHLRRRKSQRHLGVFGNLRKVREKQPTAVRRVFLLLFLCAFVRSIFFFGWSSFPPVVLSGVSSWGACCGGAFLEVSSSSVFSDILSFSLPSLWEL